MNYVASDKVIDDMAPEIDSLYKMIEYMYRYIVIDDLINTRSPDRRIHSNIYKQKKDTLNNLCSTIRSYKVSKKIVSSTSDHHYERLTMVSKITDTYLKFISEIVELEKV